ncbi:MAG TPA: dihydrodipicolinate synthase family protein [Chloroflexota bacterium]|nr:dihydrodipicolinate synthase family protein [Chloroflexota bacterium]
MSANQNRFRGIVTPLVTPVSATEELDPDSLIHLVDFQLSSGVHGLWVMGTTGEFAAFDEDERAEAVRVVVKRAAGRVPVIANISDASTRLVLRHLHRAESAGADAVAVTPPYYFPHSQAELLQHYRAVRSAAQLPVFIYNIPQTVRVSLALQTAVTLAREGAVAGIKDSQNDLEWFRQLTLEAVREGWPFSAFAGTRHLIDAAVLAGAAGAIPSIANAFPELCVEVYERSVAGDFRCANEGQTRIVDLETQARRAGGAGSKNAATISFLKQCLHERGIIATPAMTGPLLA